MTKKTKQPKIKNFKITYAMPGVEDTLNFIVERESKELLEADFKRIFKDYEIRKIEVIK
jgi:hypothetical protein